MSVDNFSQEDLINHNDELPIKEILMLAGAIAYFVMPADLIPDIIPGFGYADDLAALTAAFRAAQKIFTSVAKDKALGKAAEILGEQFNPEKAAEILNDKIQEYKSK